MTQLLNIFDSLEITQYFVDDNNIVWLHGTLLAKKLGFKNPSEAITLHTEPDERVQPQSLSYMPTVPWFVNEYGAWGMCLMSKTDEAKEFRKVLKYDVLPQIRKTGAYIDKTRFTPEQVESHTELIESFKNNTENLLKDCRKILANNVKLLIYGFVTNKSKSLPYNTFSQIHKQLLRMGFNYDTDRFKLAMKRFKETTENSLMKYVTMSDKTSLMRDDDVDLFMECLYSSMRYEGDDNDTDTSSNMILFQSTYGKKYGKHTSFERFENISTHMEDAKNLVPDSNE